MCEGTHKDCQGLILLKSGFGDFLAQFSTGTFYIGLSSRYRDFSPAGNADVELSRLLVWHNTNREFASF